MSMSITKSGGKPASGAAPASTAKSGPSLLRQKALAVQAAKPTLFLPDAKSIPSDNIEDYSWLIYGEAKIGKTSLVSNFEDSIFLMTEPGGKGLEIFQVQIGNWAELKEYVALLKSEPSKFRNVIIDTIDIAYEMCMEYVGKREKWAYPPSDDFGKGWKAVKTEFKDVMLSITATKRGVTFLSHAVEREFQKRTTGKYDKIIPSMSAQARAFIGGFVDIIGYYGYFGNERLLIIEGSDSVDSGQRIEKHFLTTSGEKLYAVPMGRSSKEGYTNIQKAFDNKYTGTNEPKQDASFSEVAVKPKKKL